MATEKHTQQGTLFDASEIPLVEDSGQLRQAPLLISMTPEREPRGQSFQVRLRRRNPWKARILSIIKAGIERFFGRSIRR